MRRVLVVDDSETLLKVATALLEEAGWAVECAKDAETGAAMAFASHPDAVVSDLWMPGLNGLMLCRMLHEDEETKHVPVILLSASADRRSRFWAKQSGARDFLKKEDIRALPALLDRFVPEPTTPRAPLEKSTSSGIISAVKSGSVARRLGTLLDRALFDSVFAREVQSLALRADTFPKLFAGLADLIGEVLPFKWMALVVYRGRGVPELSDAPDEVLAELRRILGSSLHGTMVSLGTAEGPHSVVTHRPIVDGGEALGRLVVCLPEKTATAAEVALVDLVARTLFLPLRLVGLLVETNYMACTDVMTGLFNRRHGALVLDQAIAAAKRSGAPLSIALLDIDHFKRINDVHGHPVGDEAIRHVSELLALTARKSDIVARWGGEEFLAIFPGTAEPGHRIAGERYRMRIAQTPLVVPSPEGDKTIPISISLGVAQLAGEASEDLLARADRALYRAKERGRNRVEVDEMPKDKKEERGT